MNAQQKDFEPFSDISRKKVKDAILRHYNVIESTQHPDILETAFSVFIDDMSDALIPLENKQQKAIGKVLESAAFMICNGAALSIVRQWIVGQLDLKVFLGRTPEIAQ